jgi:O-antigen/teichoic acid export membrane protein
VQNSSLKSKTINALIWNSIQRFGVLLLSFLCNLVLARLLSPSDFGSIAMLSLFIELSRIFIDSGFGAAIIQKKNITQKDLSTIFFWNLTVSVILVIILYFSAPAIAEFYQIPLLEDILRIQSISLIINSFCIIQTCKLTKELKFKILSVRGIFSALAGSLIAIVMAFFNYGVWSLVAKELIAGIVSVFLLWAIVKWRPVLIFSWTSFKELFSYGSKLLLSSLINTLYMNIQTLVIGRFFSAKDLGYYSQANKLESLSATSLTTIVGQVTFPVFSSISDDYERLKDVVRKNMKTINFMAFPLLIFLIIIAKPLIVFLFTDKWLNSVPFFQILCINGMLSPLNTANTQIFKAIGRSDIYFKLQLIKRIVGIGIILYSVQFGIMAMMWATAIVSYVFYAINLYFTHRYFIYSVSEQLKDIIPIFIVSLLSGGITYFLLFQINLANIMTLLTGIVLFSAFYIGLSHICKIDGLKYIYLIIKENLWRKVKRS